jgi:LysM domain
MDGSNRNCGSWYTVCLSLLIVSSRIPSKNGIITALTQVQSGDDCAHVSIKNGLSLQDFYFLNQEIFVNCTNLLLGVAYCVEPVGNIATYSGYPVTSQLITVPLATFTSVNTAIPTSTANPGYTYTTSLLPKASGTLQGCNTYENYNATSGTNGCSTIASLYDVSTDQLLAWNPSLSSDLSICALQPGFSYCAVQTLGARKSIVNTTGDRC